MLRIYIRYFLSFILPRYCVIPASLEVSEVLPTLHLDMSARELTFTFDGNGVAADVKGLGHYQSDTWKHLTRRYAFQRDDAHLSLKIKSIALRSRKAVAAGFPCLLCQSELDILYGSF